MCECVNVCSTRATVSPGWECSHTILFIFLPFAMDPVTHLNISLVHLVPWQWIAMFEIAAAVVLLGLASSVSLFAQYWGVMTGAEPYIEAGPTKGPGGAGPTGVPGEAEAEAAASSKAEAGEAVRAQADEWEGLAAPLLAARERGAAAAAEGAAHHRGSSHNGGGGYGGNGDDRHRGGNGGYISSGRRRHWYSTPHEAGGFPPHHHLGGPDEEERRVLMAMATTASDIAVAPPQEVGMPFIGGMPFSFFHSPGTPLLCPVAAFPHFLSQRGTAASLHATSRSPLHSRGATALPPPL